MKVYDLSAAALARLGRADLAAMQRKPDDVMAFDFHACRCGVASFVGQPPWERHSAGDELLHILSGEVELTVLGEDGAATTRLLKAGDLRVVPQGCWHRNNAASGVTVMFLTPREGAENAWDDPRLALG